jgi:UDP-N-acetylglucosamine 2-epimerase (non-hydrolysing)/GDP/UDP-N,N'-diacetylbacillosamine 2-epimerase (hydrolysing)
VATAKSIGLGVLGFADVLARLAPDMLVVLGDRFEILAAAQTALVLRIPIAHIHGGEISEGAFDDSIRHALTKLAQWHFVAAEPYRARVVQMGEPPDRVFDVGAPGLDDLSAVEWLDRAALADALGMTLGEPLLLVTYHPVTLGEQDTTRPLGELLAALDTIAGATIVFTYPNADTGGRTMLQCIGRFMAAAPERRRLFTSLGRRRYLSAMRVADVVVGNSSSGLIEAPALKRATVNIGDRQKGRLMASSVVGAAERREDIARAIRLALSDGFQRGLAATVSPYGQGDAGRRIKEQLRTVPLVLGKRFFDISHGH